MSPQRVGPIRDPLAQRLACFAKLAVAGCDPGANSRGRSRVSPRSILVGVKDIAKHASHFNIAALVPHLAYNDPAFVSGVLRLLTALVVPGLFDIGSCRAAFVASSGFETIVRRVALFSGLFASVARGRCGMADAADGRNCSG